jgi:hypothetical protein
MEFWVNSILLAVAAWVYVYVLLEPGAILGWWGDIVERLPHWLSEPLGGCEYCVGGQFALWFYVLRRGEYDLIEHILFITLTIFLITLINGSKENRFF